MSTFLSQKATTIIASWFMGFTIKITVTGMPKLLNHCVIFIVCVCVIYKCGQEPHNTNWWATGRTPMSQVLCKNNAVIALIFPSPVQIAVWFLIWTLMILILEAMKINYLLG